VTNLAGKNANSMTLMVPTLWVNALLTVPLTIGKQIFKAGELVKLPYGIALQARVTGTVTALENENEAHAQAAQYLQDYGPDSWFPSPVQTLGKFWRHIEAQRQAKGEAQNVPRNEGGETIQ